MPTVPSESEIKVTLAEDEGERLRGRLGRRTRRLRQVNHYYDTAGDDLARAGISLRVREEVDVETNERRVLLTVKEAGQRAGALMVRPERESELDTEVWDALKEGRTGFAEVDLPPVHRLCEAVRGFEGLALAALGTVENVRDVYEFEHESLAMEILLDLTTYPDGSVELELECELPQADAGCGARILRGLFDELDIDWRPSETGKYVRFRRKIGRAVEDAGNQAPPL